MPIEITDKSVDLVKKINKIEFKRTTDKLVELFEEGDVTEVLSTLQALSTIVIAMGLLSGMSEEPVTDEELETFYNRLVKDEQDKGELDDN